MVEGTRGFASHKGGSTRMAKRITVCAGIDTGKRKLDVALDGSAEQLQVDNTAEGCKTLLQWLRQHRVKRVGIEASGGYEQAVVAELRRKRFVVVVFQPAQVRAYAKFHLQRAKNDKIDAALIAACTAAVKEIHPAPDPRLLPFAEHLTLIDQIGEDIARLKNRLETCRNARLRALWKENIAHLVKLDKVGARHIQGGRERLRRALYTAALPGAFRWNRQLIALYQRLRTAGKEHKHALIACARKLLVFANAVVARGTPWQDKPQTGAAVTSPSVA